MFKFLTIIIPYIMGLDACTQSAQLHKLQGGWDISYRLDNTNLYSSWLSIHIDKKGEIRARNAKLGSGAALNHVLLESYLDGTQIFMKWARVHTWEDQVTYSFVYELNGPLRDSDTLFPMLGDITGKEFSFQTCRSVSHLKKSDIISHLSNCSGLTVNGAWSAQKK